MNRIELADQLLNRFAALEESRRSWTPVWNELAEYMLPRKKGAMTAGRGAAGDERIFDSTPMNALELLASALGGILTNPATPWFEIRARDTDAGDKEDVRKFLQQARERLVNVFNSEDTGFQAHVHELYLELALKGTAVMYVEADPETTVRFFTRPLDEIHAAENARGVVDTVFRTYELTARQAVREWGAACSEETRRMAEETPEKKIRILHAVFPRHDRDPFGFGVTNFPYACVYLEQDSKHILEESGYVEMPYMVPRWSKAAGDVYGRGPGLTALSDVRVLNAMARTTLMAAEKMSDPPLMVPDDGFLGPVRSGPGGLSYYRAGTTDRIEALPVNVDLHAAESMMKQRRESILRIFMNDRLQPADGPAISATEAVIRQSERMRLLGPVLGRLQTEFLCPLVKRVFNVMLRAGALPPFPEGLGRDGIEIRYTSPMDRVQKQYEAQGLSRTIEQLAPLTSGGDPFGITDNFNMDRIARHTAELFGTPADYLRPETQVQELRIMKRQGAEQSHA